MNPTILVVDDEHDLVKLVSYNLKKQGYDVLEAYDGNTALDLAYTRQPDLIILDLMLPDHSGYDICKEMKQHSRTKKIPIIMLTARSSELDRVSGFEAGAEDYVVKPFSPKELVLRVKAMLGRTLGEAPSEIHFENIGLSIYPQSHRVVVEGNDVNLTQIEFNILMALAEHPTLVKTREQLLNAVWKNSAEEVLDRTVDAHMKRLRSKLGACRNAIETVRGVGYRMVADSSISTPL